MTPEPTVSPTISSSTHTAAILSPACTWWILAGCALISCIIMVYAYSRKKETNLFYYWVAVIALFGGATAFFLPIAIDSGFGKDDDGSRLRQSLLYTVGGLLGVITLGETHRKNNHEKIKNEQEKYKNDQDHTRQIHAERRTRYAKAIEQLADDKVAIRLGGIYTLIGLVDEWITDDKCKDQTKEGQAIVNSLCAYIRSPFDLAEKRDILESSQKPEEYLDNFVADQAKLLEEQETRQTIFQEISKRLSKVDLVPGGIDISRTKWSEFKFSYRKATFFYPLDGLNFENADFSESIFYGKADFHRANFVGTADFQKTKFNKEADFRQTVFTGKADFRNSVFASDADFSSALHPSDTNPISRTTEFSELANFSESIFTGHANFSDSVFRKESRFVYAIFKKSTNFKYATFNNFEPYFATPVKTYGALFSSAVSTGSYEFNEYNKQGIKIELGVAKLNRKTFKIPINSRLFDPKYFNEETKECSRTSKRARPIKVRRSIFRKIFKNK